MCRKIAITLLAVVVLGAMAVLPSLAEEEETHEYVGNSKCKMCHKGEKKGMIWERWLETKHAKALESLNTEEEEDQDPGCLQCHTTGGGEPTGYNPDEPNEDLASVGCEACHGPGSDYKKLSIMKDRELAVAAGLIIPNEETCTRCHSKESPTFIDFNYEEALMLGTHMEAAAETEEEKAEEIEKVKEIEEEVKEVKEAEEVKEVKEAKIKGE